MATALRRPFGRAERRADRDSRRGSAPRMAAARGVWAFGGLMRMIARAIRLVAGIVALIIVVAIVLRVAGANPANGIVRAFHDTGRWLVGPFHNVFTEKDPKASIALNWGLAAVVYLIVGTLIASLVVRLAPSGARMRRRAD